MDNAQRSIVKCSTQGALHLLLNFAEERGWDGSKGLYPWYIYHEDTAVLMVGTNPNGYAPSSYYENHRSNFADALWFSNPTAFCQKVLADDLAEQRKPINKTHKEVTKMDVSTYLEEIVKAAKRATIQPQTPESATQDENPAAKFEGCIEIYRYAVIDNGKSLVEVSEEDFSANPTMQKSKNVQHYVRTSISICDDVQASATCKAEDYDKRQGILEAIGNLFCQTFCDVTFQTFYRRMEKLEAEYEKRSRTCPLCGSTYYTPAGAARCIEQHAKNKVERAKRHKLRKIARNELRQEEYRAKVEAMKKQLIREGEKLTAESDDD